MKKSMKVWRNKYMENYTVKCENGSFEISEKELFFLQEYKGDTAIDSQKNRYLDHKNLNLLLNFLINPNSVPIKNLIAEEKCIDILVEQIKAYIEIACKYALNTGPIDKKIYRYENKKNISGYKKGILTSLKSTSEKVHTIKSDFENTTTEPTEALTYKLYGFIPYIQIDEILNSLGLVGFHSNESEYLFPPFIHCLYTDEFEMDRMKDDNFHIIKIMDKYEDADEEKLQKSFEDYNKIKDSFDKLFFANVMAGVLSSELVELTKIISEYLKNYARCMYSKYYKAYQEKYNTDFRYNTKWGEEYRGLEETIIQYCECPDVSKIERTNLSVYTLKFLVKSGFIPEYILFQTYNDDSPIYLEMFLTMRLDDDGFRALTQEEWTEFVENFNIVAGYGNDKFGYTLPEREDIGGKIAYADYTNKESKII